MPRVCSIEGCRKVAGSSRGWCPMHYQRWRKHGDPLYAGGSHDTAERFDALVERETTERAPGLGPCWSWHGEIGPLGYGRIWLRGGRRVGAHKWAYEYFVGPIPDGFELDHLCFVPECVNPGHLEPVTHAENLRRRRPFERPIKTHCVHGHEYTSENTFVNSQGRRVCRICMRKRGRENQRKYRAQAKVAA